MYKSREDEFRMKMVEIAGFFYTADAAALATEAAKNNHVINLQTEIDSLAVFQEVGREFINATQDRIDQEWNDIIDSGFDPDKVRSHEEFVGLFGRFHTAFNQLEIIDESLRYRHDT